MLPSLAGCCHVFPLPSASLLQVVALSSRSQRQEEDLRAAATREAALQEELQAAKRAASAALLRSPSKLSGELGGGIDGCSHSVRMCC